VQRGFGEAFQKLFSRVDERAATACAAAMQGNSRVVVENVREGAIFAAPWLDALLAEGIHAVQATPLVSRAGNLLGMIATHYTHPHCLRDCEFQMMDLLARQAADYLEGR
jgi:GAF domain-containing protein